MPAANLARLAALVAVCLPSFALALRTPLASGWNLCASPSSGRRQQIPKLIHHTYKNDTLPWRFSLFRGTWPYVLKNGWNHPGGWSMWLWSDDKNRKLIEEHYPWFLETYDSYDEVISKVDAARVFYLHRYGGLYSDLDIELLKDPGPLLSGDHDLVFFYQDGLVIKGNKLAPVEPYELGVLTNALMASVPGHPFWLFLAEKMMYAAAHRPVLTGTYDRRDTMIFWTSGPSLLQNALAEYQSKEPNTKVSIFPSRHWAPFRFDCPQEQKCEWFVSCSIKYPQAYFVSHWTGTWNHCEVGTCLGDNVTIVTSLLGVKNEVKTSASSDVLCL